MDFEFEPKTLAVAFGFWAVFLVGLWKINIIPDTPGFGFAQKIILTVAALPIIFFIANWQLNR